MFGTVLSLLISSFVLLIPPAQGLLLPLPTVAFTIIAISLLFTTANISLYIASWSPLQKIEQNLTPRLVELFKSDKTLKYSATWFFAFPLLSLLIAIELAYFRLFRPPFAFALWTLLFGLSTDALLLEMRRITGFLSPYSAADKFAKRAREAAEKSDDLKLLNSVDSLSEIAIKSIVRTLPSLAKQAVDDIQEVTHFYLEACKLSSTKSDEERANLLEGSDKASYTLFTIYQRLEMINEKAVESRLEQLSTHLITTLGKIAIDSAHFDITAATYPIHYIGKLAQRAQEESLDEVTEKATCTLVEVTRIIIEEVDLKYVDIKELFFSIIKHLEEFAKQTFSQDKSVNIALLNQPFRELKKLFSQNSIAKHQDNGPILADIDRVINQFEQLELVMRTLPPIELPDEEELESERLH